MDRATAFSTLGIDAATSPGEARAIYRRRLRLLHPDLHGAVDSQLTLEAERATRQLSEAWQVVQETWSEAATRQAAAPERERSRAGARAGRSPGYPGPYAYPDEDPGPPPPPRATPPGSEECMLCGGAPVRRARLRTVHRGSNAPGRHDQRRDAPTDERRDERLCRRCGLNAFRTAQSTTLTEGWLSLSGPFRVLPAVLRNTRAWWRYTRLHDVVPPLRPVIVTVTAPAPMVRPVLARRGPLMQALAAATAIILAVGVGIGWLVGDDGGSGSVALERVNGATASAGTSLPAGVDPATPAGGALGRSQVIALPGCSAACHQVRGLGVQVNGRPYKLALVSVRSGAPAGMLRFYLLDPAGQVTWYGPTNPMHAFASRRLGGHSGSVMVQDRAGHVFVDLLTGADSALMAVLSLGNGINVRDFSSLGPLPDGQYRFATNTTGADAVSVDKSAADDIVLLRAAADGRPAYYDFYKWDRTDFVFRACARQLVNGDYGSFQPAGTCG